MNAKTLKSFIIFLIIVAVFAYFANQIKRSGNLIEQSDGATISESFLQTIEQLESISFDVEFISNLDVSQFRTSVIIPPTIPKSSTGRSNPFTFTSVRPSAPAPTLNTVIERSAGDEEDDTDSGDVEIDTSDESEL